MNRIAVIGAGGHAREVTETLVTLGTAPESISYYVDGKFLGEASALSPALDIEELALHLEKPDSYLAVGDGALRESFQQRLGDSVSYPNLIHPSSIIGSNCLLGIGTQVHQFATVTANVRIGRFAQLNIYAGISHDCIIGDFFTASPKASVSGNVKIGNHVFLGLASAVFPDITICDHVVIGAGAVVTKDIMKPGTYFGIPARKIK